MSHKQNPPRQDRRSVGRSPVTKHAGVESVGTSKPPTILDKNNGSPFSMGGGNAPGSSGPATTGDDDED
jgi:hypothetical protein